MNLDLNVNNKVKENTVSNSAIAIEEASSPDMTSGIDAILGQWEEDFSECIEI